MNIDPNLLKGLSSVDPRELSDKISAISKLLGVDEGYIRSLIGTPEEMQKKLEGLSERDIKDISGKIDPSLMKKLNRGK